MIDIKIISTVWKHPLLCFPNAEPPTDFANMVLVTRPVFENGKLVALSFDAVQYCFISTQGVARGMPVKSYLSAVSRSATDDGTPEYAAWPFPPSQALAPWQAELVRLANERVSL